MRTTNRNNQASGGDGFLSANAAWLMPLLGTLMVITASMLVNVMGAEQDLGWSIPSWLIALGVVAGGISTGIGAIMTDTIAAKVLRTTIAAVVVGGGICAGILALVQVIRG